VKRFSRQAQRSPVPIGQGFERSSREHEGQALRQRLESVAEIKVPRRILSMHREFDDRAADVAGERRRAGHECAGDANAGGHGARRTGLAERACPSQPVMTPWLQVAMPTTPFASSATKAVKPAPGPKPSRSQSASVARTACSAFSPSANSRFRRISAGMSAGRAARTSNGFVT
jgi:hypothetical protein